MGETEAFLDPGFVSHSSLDPRISGSHEYAEAVRGFRAAFPDVHTTPEDVLVDGDRVAVRGRDRATHQGDFMGIPATGREVTATWTEIFRMEDGKAAGPRAEVTRAASRSLDRVNDDAFRLHRFVDAQAGGVHPKALDELHAGRKTSHWMWFVFPQVSGLGTSPMSQLYAIGSLAEARAYLDHPVLGPRLVESAQAVLSHPDRTARQIMGSPDDAKLRSSMTLFALVPGSAPVFQQVLDTFFAGERDPRTVNAVGARP